MSVKYPSVAGRLIIILISVCFFQCGDSEPENIGEIDCSLKMVSNAAMQGKLTIESAYLRLTELQLRGTPPSQDVETYSQNINGVDAPVSLNSIDEKDIIRITAKENTYEPLIATLNIQSDTYQLVYTSDNSPDFAHFTANAKPAMFLSAKFDNRGKTLQVYVSIDELLPLNVAAKQFDSPSVEVGIYNTAEIFFNPIVWFENVTPQELESANKIMYNDQEAVFIHRQYNSDLYQKIQNKVEDASGSMAFKFNRLK